MAKKFKLGKLTEDDFDQDFVPGRSEKTMSADHKKSLAAMGARIDAAAAKIKKRDEGEQIVIVLEREQ